MTEKKQLWQIWDNLAFARSFHSFRMALSPARMVIALIMVLMISAIGWFMDLVAAPGRTDEPWAKQVRDEDAIAPPGLGITGSDSPTGRSYNAGAGAAFRTAEGRRRLAASPAQAFEEIEGYRQQQRFGGVFSALWHFGADRFNTGTISLFRLEITDVLSNLWLCALALVWAFRFHPVYSSVYFVFLAMVTCVCGGGICRTAALEFARGEKPGMVEGLGFGLKKFRSLISAPLILAGITAAFAVVVVIAGFIGNIPYAGEIFIAVTLGFSLIFGLLTLLFLIGSVAGAGLIFPTVAYEGSDGHDAISRSFCYVYRRPWWLFVYVVIAAAFGTICYLFVRVFVYGVLITTYLLLEVGIATGPDGDKLARIWGRPDFFVLLGPNTGPTGLSEQIAAMIVYATMLFMVGLVVAFVVSFFFCASTIIYALMRRKVDEIEMDSVYTALEHVGVSESGLDRNGI